MYSAPPINIINIRVTFRKASVPLLEAISFRDLSEAYEALRFPGVQESVVLQTCNRVELYLVTAQKDALAEKIKEYLASRAGVLRSEVLRAIEVSMNEEALLHLLKVASGIDSMVIGENEILRQVWDAYLEAEKRGAAGPILHAVFERALKVGKRVRSETGISRGAISVGSVAVKFADSLLGGIEGRNVLVIGAGEMGTAVAKALTRHKPNAIFIANRTHERALKLAEKVSGKALRFDMLEEALREADVVICATAAPHYTLTREKVAKAMEQRQRGKEMLLIDISNPRNVEEAVGEVNGVRLYCIDDLQPIVSKNLEERRRSVGRALEILEEELSILCKGLKIQMIHCYVSRLMTRVEDVRREEVAKALKMLGEVDEKERKIIENLTGAIVKKLFMPIVENLRDAALNGDSAAIEYASRLLELLDPRLLHWGGRNE